MLRTTVFLPMLMHFEHAITISLTVVQSTKLAAACQTLTRPRSTKGQRTVINVTTYKLYYFSYCLYEASYNITRSSTHYISQPFVYKKHQQEHSRQYCTLRQLQMLLHLTKAPQSTAAVTINTQQKYTYEYIRMWQIFSKNIIWKIFEKFICGVTLIRR